MLVWYIEVKWCSKIAQCSAETWALELVLVHSFDFEMLQSIQFIATALRRVSWRFQTCHGTSATRNSLAPWMVKSVSFILGSWGSSGMSSASIFQEWITKKAVGDASDKIRLEQILYLFTYCKSRPPLFESCNSPGVPLVWQQTCLLTLMQPNPRYFKKASLFFFALTLRLSSSAADYCSLLLCKRLLFTKKHAKEKRTCCGNIPLDQRTLSDPF